MPRSISWWPPRALPERPRNFARSLARVSRARRYGKDGRPIIYLKQYAEVSNAGDAIGAHIVRSLTGRRVRLAGEPPLDIPNLIGIGSIVHWSDAHSMLWGCGLIAPSLKVRAPAAVLALRGPLSRDALAARGIPCPDVLGDVGLLAPAVFAPAPRRDGIGVVPHYVDRGEPFVRRAEREGMRVIDVALPPARYVEQLTACERVLSSSLHGIVIAHAYGIPAAWVQLSDRVHGGGFKFRDYYASLGIAPRDVVALAPERDSLSRMAAACWLPPALPDAETLRAALAAQVGALDVEPEVAA